MDDRALYVRLGGKIPEDVIAVAARTEKHVTFFAAGGGFECVMPTERFDRLHRLVDSSELTRTPVYETRFDIDEMFGELPGYSEGHRWNGWACPLFPIESCRRIISQVDGGRFDPVLDAFVIPRENPEPGDDPADTYRSRLILVEGRAVKVWPIGSGRWTWDEYTGNTADLETGEM